MKQKNETLREYLNRIFEKDPKLTLREQIKQSDIIRLNYLKQKLGIKE